MTDSQLIANSVSDNQEVSQVIDRLRSNGGMFVDSHDGRTHMAHAVALLQRFSRVAGEMGEPVVVLLYRNTDYFCLNQLRMNGDKVTLQRWSIGPGLGRVSHMTLEQLIEHYNTVVAGPNNTFYHARLSNLITF